jgi:hypothetical protein
MTLGFALVVRAHESPRARSIVEGVVAASGVVIVFVIAIGLSGMIAGRWRRGRHHAGDRVAGSSGTVAGTWDEWWRRRLASGGAQRFPYLPTRIQPAWAHLSQVANNDDLLVSVMREYGLRTVLCAGNGVSQEPKALAAAGFDVTALDISAVAGRAAEADDPHDRGWLDYVCNPAMHRPDGRVSFVVGDLRDAAVCPGPFDVVIDAVPCRCSPVTSERRRCRRSHADSATRASS